MRERNCALVVVGNEILSGKVQDSNAFFAAREFRNMGVALSRIATIPDDLAIIAEEVAYCSRHFDFVITSGGVGPTHDDMTMEGVAMAFKRPLVMHPQLEGLIREHFKERSLVSGLKMAEVPEGAVLNDGGDIRFPTVQIENVYVLPGIPQLLLGSYPRIGDPEYRVKLTLESKNHEYLERAFRHLMGLLPSEVIVKT